MELDFRKFKRFIETYANPRWEQQDEKWPLRPGGGEAYIQNKVINKAAPCLSKEALQSNPLENVSNALRCHHNLLNRYDLMYAKVFLDQVNENDLKTHVIDLIHGAEDWEIRLKKFHDWSKVAPVPGEKIKTGFSARVTSYLLSMHNPRLYPFCKPTAYNAAVESLLSKKEKKKDRVERIIHCKSIYTEVLQLLEKEYGLVNGNLLDVHSLFHIYSSIENGNGGKNYWWFIANPKIWKFNDYEIGKHLIYTNRSEKGNKSKIFKYFEEVQPGDLIICYSASPDREVVGKSQVTKGLHKTDEGEGFEFEIIEKFKNPVKWSEIQTLPELQESEPVVHNNQGSLFRLRKDELETINVFIDKSNPPSSAHVENYNLNHELANLFIKDEDFKSYIELLKYKKNLILQGPPGTGKTFLAKHLAYALMGKKDNTRVPMIQFHQSYSYEDFIQGFRPNEDGKFDLKNGIFYEFCRKAQRDSSNQYQKILFHNR
jgi:hypothetical protein